jgi:hypothetical protein
MLNNVLYRTAFIQIGISKTASCTNSSLFSQTLKFHVEREVKLGTGQKDFANRKECCAILKSTTLKIQSFAQEKFELLLRNISLVLRNSFNTF